MVKLDLFKKLSFGDRENKIIFIDLHIISSQNYVVGTELSSKVF